VDEIHRAIDRVAHRVGVIAAAARIVQDVGLANWPVPVAALQQWPASGVPSNPGAWLTGR
jgi:predicted RNA polymerase sigma factor